MWPFPKSLYRAVVPVTNDSADMILATMDTPILRLEVIRLSNDRVTVRPVIDIKHFQPNPIWAGELITVGEGDSIQIPHQLFTLKVEP